MSVERNIAYWNGKWMSNQSSNWHCHVVNPVLREHYELLFPSGVKGTVLVPLCGKSEDLLWLYEKGHHVIGIESCEKAVQDYFSEVGLSYKTKELRFGKLFESDDGRLQIYACDFFLADQLGISRCDAVWDRGSIVAIDEFNRKKYTSIIKNLLRPEFRYLMNVYAYLPNEVFSGPPSSVPLAEVRTLFGSFANCNLVSSADMTEVMGFSDMGINEAAELVILLQNK